MMRLPPRLAHKLSSVTGWPLRVLLCGLVFTAAVTWNVNTRVTGELQNQFELHADRLQGDAQRRLNQPLYGLMGARGMLAAMPQFTQAEFRAYVESRDLDREFPGIRGFGWIERVARADLSAFVAAVQADNAVQFAVRTGGTASDLYVIRHIEPLANNRSAWGFDVGSDAVRRAAVEQAVRSGQATLTAPVALQQDAQRSPGFLLLLPVYTRGAVVDTPEQRQRHLRGLLYAPIVAHEILADVTVIADGQLDFKVYDGPVVDASRLVYDDDHLTRAAGSLPTDLQRRHTALRSIAIGDRQLSLQANSLPAFHATHHSALPAVVGAAGVLLSLLVAGLTAVLVRGRQRVEARAQELTQDLSRLAMVAKHTSNAVIVTDVARRITWVNDGFSRTTGYSFAEAMGCNPGKLLQFDDTDPATIADLRASLDVGQAYRCTLLNRAKDGRVYWIDLEVQPLRTDSGVLEGFMAIESDVTAARQAADALALERTRLGALLGATGAGEDDRHVAQPLDAAHLLSQLKPADTRHVHVRPTAPMPPLAAAKVPGCVQQNWRPALQDRVAPAARLSRGGCPRRHRPPKRLPLLVRSSPNWMREAPTSLLRMLATACSGNRHDLFCRRLPFCGPLQAKTLVSTLAFKPPTRYGGRKNRRTLSAGS